MAEAAAWRQLRRCACWKALVDRWVGWGVGWGGVELELRGGPSPPPPSLPAPDALAPPLASADGSPPASASPLLRPSPAHPAAPGSGWLDQRASAGASRPAGRRRVAGGSLLVACRCPGRQIARFEEKGPTIHRYRSDPTHRGKAQRRDRELPQAHLAKGDLEPGLPHGRPPFQLAGVRYIGVKLQLIACCGRPICQQPIDQPAAEL
eukprot:scaffold20371_cov102-Isochrysis_galbana.AAC.7